MTKFIFVLLRRIKRFLITLRNRHQLKQRTIFIKNININYISAQKRILISYICAPFDVDNCRNIRHANLLGANQIVKYFIDNDFIVDIINCDETDYKYILNERKYDVIFGFGEPYKYVCKKNPESIKILLLTENNPVVALKKINERYDYYEHRTGKRKFGIRRDGLFDIEQFEISDWGVLLNGKYNAKYSEKYLKNIKLLNTIGIKNINYTFIPKDFAELRHSFVWFGSPGAIHKGLDLLIDVFKEKPDYILHVCGLSKSEQFLIQKHTDNIIAHGYVDVSSDYFINEIVNKCAFSVLPSCSEGVSSSVATCMLHGLIPIVTRDVGIEVDGLGYYLEDFKIEYLKKELHNIVNTDVNVLQEKSQAAYTYANREFVLETYTSNLNHHLNTILKS